MSYILRKRKKGWDLIDTAPTYKKPDKFIIERLGDPTGHVKNKSETWWHNAMPVEIVRDIDTEQWYFVIGVSDRHSSFHLLQLIEKPSILRVATNRMLREGFVRS